MMSEESVRALLQSKRYDLEADPNDCWLIGFVEALEQVLGEDKE